MVLCYGGSKEMSEERASYIEIRHDFLDSYYTCCKHKLHIFNLTGDLWGEGESEVGYASYQWENAYDLPVENLMLEVIILIMRAGRGPEIAEENGRKAIAEILAKNPLDELLTCLDDEEKNSLLYDMSLLGLIESNM
ncbi:hypothetical protein HL670_01153 [Serratia plymuthica]|nr:hypothetical protein HL670_01153 [Serratia plymuthica]